MFERDVRVAPTEEERVRGEGKECVWETRQSTARCRREGMCAFEIKGRKSA